MDSPRLGSIIIAGVLDPQRRNLKDRPLVVVTKTAEIVDSGVLVAVAITGTFTEPLSDDKVRLPYHPTGNVMARLRKPSVAKCSWILEIETSAIRAVKGHVPRAQLEQIISKLPL